MGPCPAPGFSSGDSSRDDLVVMPVIPATQERESRRIIVQSQPQANSLRDPILKIPSRKKGLMEWLKV
jgi:hypothetical protein